MELATLQPVYTGASRYVSAAMDVGRTTAQGSHQVDVRWRDLADAVHDVDPEVLEIMGGRLTAPTGLGGELGRLVVMAGNELVLDRLLPAPPSRDQIVAARIPYLMPLVRARADQTPYVKVLIDHAGADIEFVDGTPQAPDTTTSEGGTKSCTRCPAAGGRIGGGRAG